MKTKNVLLAVAAVTAVMFGSPSGPHWVYGEEAGPTTIYSGDDACPDYAVPGEEVCGTDGITYASKCWAKHAGVGIAHLGVCQSAPAPTPWLQKFLIALYNLIQNLFTWRR